MNYVLPHDKVFNCVMKTRVEMEKDIPKDLLGWWHDCLPGQTVKLRQATKEDLARSWVRFKAPQTPEHYMVELHERGCLILKLAIKEISAAGLPSEEITSVISDIRASLESRFTEGKC